MTKKSDYSLELSVYFSDSLFSSNALETLRSIFEQEIPEWSAGLHFWLDFAGRIPFSGDLVEEIREFALRRGSFYPKSAQVQQRAEGERRFGSAELHGAEKSLLVVVSCDDLSFAPSSGRYRCANSVFFQFRAPTCAGKAVEALVPRILTRFARSSNLLFGNALFSEEWDAKNMCFETGAMAIGGDISRYLPGLYWINYFGPRYTEIIGRECLLSSPAFFADQVSDGVLVQVDEKPGSWSTESSKYASVMQHIGEQYFFLRHDPTRITVAPDFNLPKLKRFARFT